MIVHFEDRDWEFDTDKITVDEWRELKRKYKMTPKAFQDVMAEADPDASTFAYWTMLRHGGQPAAILGDHLKPDIIQLNQALAAALEVEAAAEEERERAELAAEAERQAGLARALPTLPAGPPSAEPPSRPDTTLTPPSAPETAASTTASGTATSSSSAPSTSSSSPASADLLRIRSGG